ncbi:MAG: redoxin family protein [Gammaproteobacteria bacterium]|nr:redoxin family protein [Gammaproteobacteria bacterium]
MRQLIAVVTLLFAMIVQGAESRPLPEFTTSNPADWFNSEPLVTADLRGKVLLVDVWTFGCWNCYRSFPWMKAMEARLADEPFQIVGIHSPEFDHERDRANVAAKIAEFGLTHPVMLDNDFAYWRRLNNRYWPAFYLVDRSGTIRHLHVGETHEGDARAIRIEQQIRALLDE